MDYTRLPRWQKHLAKISRMTPQQKGLLSVIISDSAGRFADEETRKGLESLKAASERNYRDKSLAQRSKASSEMDALRMAGLKARGKADSVESSLRARELALDRDNLSWKQGMYNQDAARQAEEDLMNRRDRNLAEMLGYGNLIVNAGFGVNEIARNNADAERYRRLRSMLYG